MRSLPDSESTPGIFWRANIGELFAIYFEIAHDNEYDCTPFVACLSDTQFAHAKSGVRTVWATNNDDRRTVMAKTLFSVLTERLTEEDALLITLNRLVRIGQLTFERRNPGKRAPVRFAKSGS